MLRWTQFRTFLPALLSVPVVLWGARTTFLEGFVFAVPRGFNGDFLGAMYPGGQAPDLPTSIVYGPIFLYEQWLTHFFPSVFTITTYAILCWALAAVAFTACIGASGLRMPLVPWALALWLVFVSLYYAFSIAAELEILMLAFLSLAWWGAATNRARLEGAFVAAAGLTKLIPFVFVIPLVLRRDRRALLAFAATVAIAIAVASIGLRTDPFHTAFQALLPFGRSDVGSSVAFASMVVITEEMRGINSAIARALHVPGEGGGIFVGPEAALAIQIATGVIILGCVAAATWVAYAVRGLRLASRTATALTYAAFFTLVPIGNLLPHTHTFVFVMPAAVALLAVLDADPNVPRRLASLAYFGIAYVYVGVSAVPLLVDRSLRTSVFTDWWAGHDPIWGVIAMLVGAVIYVLSLRSRPLVRTSSAAVAA